MKVEKNYATPVVSLSIFEADDVVRTSGVGLKWNPDWNTGDWSVTEGTEFGE